MIATRIISDPTGKPEIVVISDEEYERIYRRNQNAEHWVAKEGLPGDSGEFFKLPKGMPDGIILKCVDVYEQGHSQGWRDGQWQLKRDFRQLMGIPQP